MNRHPVLCFVGLHDWKHLFAIRSDERGYLTRERCSRCSRTSTLFVRFDGDVSREVDKP